MDKDLNELEQLADETHADLQEKPKKQTNRDVNGLSADLKENGEKDPTTASTDVLTQASQNATSTTTLNEASNMSAKQSNNRASLQEQQMTTKVNQDLFYQMPADQDEKQQSPDRTKDSKAPPEPVPDFGTPLKASKSDEAE